jgi:predicted DCC family thiol-disulfide oxidoreductase YuxK
LCVREVRFLRGRDRHHRIAFVDIDAPDYDPTAYAGISYRTAMGRIHALNSNGDVLQDIAVFREAYRLIGLGWLYAPTRWPVVAPLANLVYGFWASKRLQWTGRSDLDTLCRRPLRSLMKKWGKEASTNCFAPRAISPNKI